MNLRVEDALGELDQMGFYEARRSASPSACEHLELTV